MHFEREALDIINLSYNKNELNRLFEMRKELAEQSRLLGTDNSVQIKLVNNRIKSILCLL